MKRARYQTGSVVFDKRRGTWALLWREDGKRRSRLLGTKAQYPTKAAARKAAEMIKLAVAAVGEEQAVPLVNVLVERFRAERMPDRQSTRRGYNSYLNNYILPVWGALPITALQPRQVELWLKGLHLAPKSKAHIRGLLSNLVEYSMWSGAIPVSTNPITLVKLSGTSRPAHKRRSLTPEQFHTFTKSLSEPFRTMALLCASLGLRISECLALKWEDVDWLNARLAVRRGIVRQIVASTKTLESQKDLPLSVELVDLLARWKQQTQFGEPADWVFASPIQVGKLPWSYPNVWRVFKLAAIEAGTGHISPHVLRHTYRAWLAESGVPLELQRRLMRHSSISMTMQYGELETISAMQETNEKIAGMALNGSRSGLQER